MVLFGEAGQLFQWGVGSPPAASWHRDPTQRLLLVPFSAATSQPWGDVVPMPSQAICHPPVSIAWPSRRMSVLETERLSPSPPFSGEGAQSFIHSETRLINNVLLPARVLPLVSASLKQWENTFSRKVAVPFPGPCLSIPGRQCGPNPLYAPGRGGWSWGPVIAALLAG